MLFPLIYYFRLMRHFKVPYANFTNYNEGEVGNYFFINEKYYPARQLLTPPGKKPALNETALRQVLLFFFQSMFFCESYIRYSDISRP
jgi:hypothetical protein